jgi:hypothetical protein
MTTPGDVRSFAHSGTNSGPSIRGTGSSNPFPSADESGMPLILRRDARNSRVYGRIFGVVVRAQNFTMQCYRCGLVLEPKCKISIDVAYLFFRSGSPTRSHAR